MIENHAAWWGKQRRIKRERFHDLTARLRQRSEIESKLLPLRIIDAGYRTLAMQMHPDRGGSHEDMQRLNEARQELHRMIET